jgi:hypothetical protein
MMVYAVRSAASITPPVAPKMTLAPVLSPSRLSKSSSGSLLKLMLHSLIMRASSRVVITSSTSGLPPWERSGRLASTYLAGQGSTDTTTISLGSMPAFSA